MWCANIGLLNINLDYCYRLLGRLYRLCNQVRRLTRKAQKIYEKSIISQIKENPKKFWQYAQAKIKTRTGIPNLIKSDSKDDLTNSDSEKVFTREPQENTPEEPIRCYNTVETCTINPSVVAAKLKKLKTFKTPGPDGIHPRVLNELADCINIPLSTIFNTSLTTGKLPKEWKQANISPIHKKGSKTLPQNYRPVSITSVVGKIMEEIIRDTITVHMKKMSY